ncbi:epidermal growth factor-like protein 7 isoform X2 [Limulus polyphemus]|uniref:Epidermal growth factor-like protein 7 isoform X2 n=1 Tax=Limulus polyphemus TaxID=6850 RepID=A0ABM1SP98_LIMPO|nr:epidermal growth factor-like protein 7 isoform X2 [Limulus polyphemus]
MASLRKYALCPYSLLVLLCLEIHTSTSVNHNKTIQNYHQRASSSTRVTSRPNLHHRVVGVVYERAYRSVYKIATQTERIYACCPGWTQISPASHGCMKALCTRPCRNSGKCTKPGYCSCPKGWTGTFCEIDVNECEQDENVCDHQCINTLGSYRCGCHKGFKLQSDGRSCKISLNRVPEYQEFLQVYEELTKKVMKMEKIQEKRNFTRLEIQLESLANKISSLQKESLSVSTTTPPSLNDRPNSVGENYLYGSPWDRISSLSEQISILEERLEGCTCKQQRRPPQ